MKYIIRFFCVLLLTNFISNSQAVEITVWEDTYVSSTLKQAAEDFYKLTGTKVKFETGNYVYGLEKLRLDGPAGEGPDIILLPNDQIGQAVKEGMIVPVEFEDEEEVKYLPLAKEAALYRDVYYFVPRTLETLAVFYNKDFIDKPFKTIDEWIKYDLSMQKKNKYGFVAKFDDLYFLYGAIEPYGGYIFYKKENGNYDISKLGLNNHEAVSAVRSIKRFYDLNLIPTATMGSGAVNNIVDLFIKNRVTAIIAGSWNIPVIMKRKVNFGIAQLPILENGMHMSSFIGVRGYAISQWSEHYEEALKFAKFLNKDKYLLQRYKETKELPTTLSSLKNTAINKDHYARPFLDQIRFGYLMPQSPEISYIWPIYATKLFHIFSGRDSVEFGLNSAEKEYKSQLRRNPKNKF
ncbi:MAG: extracellular solute-binding protein [Succinivibrio sp.]|nr:extracellular solute-binding protein [Succinivibrio sp.]